MNFDAELSRINKRSPHKSRPAVASAWTRVYALPPGASFNCEQALARGLGDGL